MQSTSVIPHTQQATGLARKPVGGFVNLESNIIGRYVIAHNQATGGGMSMQLSALSERLDTTEGKVEKF